MDLDRDNYSPNAIQLFEKNKFFTEQFKKSPLMQLIESDKMANKLLRNRLFDCIQVFSDYFQKVVMLRNIFCDDPKFLPLTNEHLQEEFGHNLSLWKDRGNRPGIWDPILEATASWFAWKMFTLDDIAKTLLVHLVLETSANTFFHFANKAITSYGETNYFAIHAEADEKHEKMGKDLLKDISQEKLERLLVVQQQGWDVLNATCDRIAAITLQV